MIFFFFFFDGESFREQVGFDSVSEGRERKMTVLTLITNDHMGKTKCPQLRERTTESDISET